MPYAQPVAWSAAVTLKHGCDVTQRCELEREGTYRAILYKMEKVTHAFGRYLGNRQPSFSGVPRDHLLLSCLAMQVVQVTWRTSCVHETAKERI